MSEPSKTTAFAEPINIGVQSIATAYAKALFGAAVKGGVLDQVVGDLNAVIADVVLKHQKLADVLASNMFGPEHKVEMIERAFAKQVHPLVVNLLKVLAQHERSYILRPIQQQLEKLYNKSRGRVPVRVVSAAALTEAQRQSVATKMKSVLGGDPVLQTEVDPTLIGGLVVQVGDVVYDGSLSANLARLREHMINRSVHEIQRRRDSVRTSS
jgi:F-type H+-transporting ATPase subunit delta